MLLAHVIGTLAAGLPSLIGVGGILDPEHLLETFGYIGLFAIVFAESGLLIGFFLPGDSLLFTAGLIASGSLAVGVDFNIGVVLAGCFVSAVAGDSVGYSFGRRVGPALFRRPNSRIFRQEHVEKARHYFERYGSKTIVLARFVPIVRTFAPILAGVGTMSYRTFVTFNVLGGLLWAVGVTLLGYSLGSAFPWIEDYLLPTIGVVILLSILPIAIEFLKARRNRARERVDA
ncbi:MAG: DedA family protein [Acidimicrobiia bacterium]